MAKELKHIRMTNEMINSIQEIADSTLDGNFTSAAEALVNQALLLRSLDERHLWTMYSSVSSEYKKTGDAKEIRVLLDALHL